MPDCATSHRTTQTGMAFASWRFHFLWRLENPGPEMVLRAEVSNGSRNVGTHSRHPTENKIIKL
jgi:hypothetical protein